MSDFEAPQSRNEAILQNMLGANNELEAPQSRIEALLQQILENGGGGGGGGGVYTVNVAYDQNANSATADKTAGEIYNAARSGLVNFVIAYTEDSFASTDVCALTMASRGEDAGDDTAWYAFAFSFRNGQISVLLTAEGDNTYPVGIVE